MTTIWQSSKLALWCHTNLQRAIFFWWGLNFGLKKKKQTLGESKYSIRAELWLHWLIAVLLPENLCGLAEPWRGMFVSGEKQLWGIGAAEDSLTSVPASRFVRSGDWSKIWSCLTAKLFKTDLAHLGRSPRNWLFHCTLQLPTMRRHNIRLE